MITLNINGKKRTLDPPTRLVDYLESLEVNTKFIAVALNGTARASMRSALAAVVSGAVRSA